MGHDYRDSDMEIHQDWRDFPDHRGLEGDTASHQDPKEAPLLQLCNLR